MPTDSDSKWLNVLEGLHTVTDLLRGQITPAAPVEATVWLKHVDTWIELTRVAIVAGRLVKLDQQRAASVEQQLQDIILGRRPKPKQPRHGVHLLSDMLGQTYGAMLYSLPGESEVPPPPPPPKALSEP